MNVHFIAIGGSAMHNLAIALHKKGIHVTGSDDEVFEPSRSRLRQYGLLPVTEGWDTARITASLDAVILGMHAHADNPELAKAKELGLKIYSYPEYIYEQSKNKLRVVIGGSHGKTTITAIILHVLNYWKKDFDYMVGSQLTGFDTMVKLTDDAPLTILEGDEYLSSPVDRRPKFHLYKADIALISGIAWDHINVFPTFESYLEEFRIFANQLPDSGTLIYCEDDPEVKKICEAVRPSVKKIPYSMPLHEIRNGITYIKSSRLPAGGQTQWLPLQIFGLHNLFNLNGARMVCREIGVGEEQFEEAIQSFGGAAKRLERVGENAYTAVYKDFAHAPSKLKATTQAVKQQYPQRKLVACMELHTYSSLNENFLKEYKGSMQEADEAAVYFNPHAIAIKRLKPVSPEVVKEAFDRHDLVVFTDSKNMQEWLRSKTWKNANLLLMSSGNFDGMDYKALAEALLRG